MKDDENQYSYWQTLVEKIKRDETAGFEELYNVFSQGVRFYLCKQLGPQDLDDRIHDVFLIVTQSIQADHLREPARLMGYVRTIVRRFIAEQIQIRTMQRARHLHLDAYAEEVIVRDPYDDPEAATLENEKTRIAHDVLMGLTPKKREILIRFYFFEQSAEQIRNEMNLTDTQFRLLKSRTKARFLDLVRKRMKRKPGFIPKEN